MSGCDRPAKQRFKGIENFLRRVAFNLGNTPSQTEVKIISCIPIDVTDLQQKITALERELCEVREAATFHENILCEAKNVKINPNPTRAYTSIIQTALGKPNPTFSTQKVLTQCKFSQAKTPVASHGVNTKLDKGKSRFRRKLSSLCIVSSLSSRNKGRNSKLKVPEKELQTPAKACCKIVPKRFRRAMRKTRGKTHMIYFTDTSKTPFNNYITSESFLQCDDRCAPSKNAISRSYINSMIRKQYESELIVDDLTDISQFTTPACRDSDTEPHSSQSPHYYDSFKSLDRTSSSKNDNFNVAAYKGLPIDQGPIITNYQFNDGINYSGYYDSNYYDIYPVKEKSMKHKRDEPFPKQSKRLNSDDFLNDPVRIVNNFRPLVFDNEIVEQVSKKQNKHTYRVNDGNGHEYKLTNVIKKKPRNNECPKVSLNESKLCSIEYGNVYLKRNHAVECIEKTKPIAPILKNAECLTLNTNNMECQTVESKGVQLNILEDNKAELVLDQIKTILQSVLAEVKTNMRSNIAESKQKKSVPIQKDVSHKNVTDGSTLLHSFTYNPSCSLNPCLTSYSRHVPNFCYPNFSPVPMKCFQHYPLLVPPIKHFGCNCRHKHKLSSEKYKKTATHTETEGQMAQKSETVNLIKEIYKSVPLNVYYSNKATSRNSFGYLQNNHNAEVKTVNSRVISVTERSVGDDKVYEAPYNSPTLTSYTANDNTDTAFESIQSEILSGILNRNDAKPSQSTTNYASVKSVNQKDSQTTTSLQEEKVANVVEQVEKEGGEREEAKHDHVQSNLSDSETDSDGTLVAEEAAQRKEKPGLFMKVLQTVRKLKRKKKLKRHKSNAKSATKDDSLSEDSETDSQTVYSYKTYRDLKNVSQSNIKQMKSTIQSNRDSDQPIPENLKRLSPYMEQEYRRYWDETLMFNDAKPKLHSSERSFPSWTRSPHSPIYWRHFEARSALLRDEHLKLQQENKKECSQVKQKPGAILQKEKTGFKLEWMKKQKTKPANK